MSLLPALQSLLLPFLQNSLLKYFTLCFVLLTQSNPSFFSCSPDFPPLLFTSCLVFLHPLLSAFHFFLLPFLQIFPCLSPSYLPNKVSFFFLHSPCFPSSLLPSFLPSFHSYKLIPCTHHCLFSSYLPSFFMCSPDTSNAPLTHAHTHTHHAS